jgi:hypothetical protein
MRRFAEVNAPFSVLADVLLASKGKEHFFMNFRSEEVARDVGIKDLIDG